jgi:hypothetical protein
MGVKIQLRRDTATNWSTINPILAQGEPGYETDTGKLKFGDGSLHWNDLSYFADGASLTIEQIEDTFGTSFLVAGSGIILNYNDNGNSLTISASGGGGGSTTVVNLTFNTSLNTDASSGDIFDVTLTDNVTINNPTNPVNGKTIRWRISQDGSGNRSVTLGDKFVIPSSASSPLPWSTEPNKMDIFAATYHSGRDKWDVVAFVPGY